MSGIPRFWSTHNLFGDPIERPIWPAATMDDLGRCCGRKPLIYKRDRYFFCTRCDRAYDLGTRRQINNWAWCEVDGGFVQQYPANVIPAVANRRIYESSNLDD